MILSALKKANDNRHETNVLMALGMEKDAAKAFSRRIVKAYKNSGATAQQKQNTSAVIQQIMCKGKVDEMEIRTLAENCPPLVQAMMTYFGYTHRNLIRHAAKGKVTTRKFIEAVMKGIK